MLFMHHRKSFNDALAEWNGTLGYLKVHVCEKLLLGFKEWLTEDHSHSTAIHFLYLSVPLTLHSGVRIGFN